MAMAGVNRNLARVNLACEKGGEKQGTSGHQGRSCLLSA
jgi:hypothetical protein